MSADDGVTWRRARPIGAGTERTWQRWRSPGGRPTRAQYTLRARATDVIQPAVAPYNTSGYLFGAVVAHPVTAI